MGHITCVRGAELLGIKVILTSHIDAVHKEFCGFAVYRLIQHKTQCSCSHAKFYICEDEDRCPLPIQSAQASR